MPKQAAKKQSSAWEEPNAVELHVVLDDIDPPIWRRLLVPLDTNLAQLHHILQAAFGWQDYHLHQFEIGGLYYGDAEFVEAGRFDDFMPRTFEASDVQLKDFHIDYDRPTTFRYVYDFGDHWVHSVTIEKKLVAKPVPKSAKCLGGARACPPEDVGGTMGYANFLRVLFDPDEDELEEQEHLKEWSGGRFEPERFTLTKTDKTVRGAQRKRRRD